jgi:hypothetical protein
MKTFLTLAALIVSASSASAEPIVFESAAAPATLIELFSSEGCSSCPPAEAWISALKKRPDLWQSVVPVVFHVDYWNNLGWPDRFASPAFSDRQRRYASAWRNDSVYTPGFVVDGREWRGWFDHEKIPSPAKPAKVGKLRVTLRDRNRVEIVFTPTGAVPKSARVEVALLGGNLVSEVTNGENGGRRLIHDFVALGLATAALAPEGGGLAAALQLPAQSVASPNAIAAWVTAGEGQPPIQATGGWLKTR